jgi:uncharacterized repeat protein (TIGR01451 family)
VNAKRLLIRIILAVSLVVAGFALLLLALGQPAAPAHAAPLRQAPSNDNFANALVISTLPYSNTQSTTSATTQTGDPVFPCIANSGTTNNGRGWYSVWYVYTPTVAGTLHMDTIGSDYDTVLGVWRGAWGSLTNVGCDDDSGPGTQSLLDVSVVSGTVYYVEIAGYYSTSSGNLVISASLVTPANDDFGNAFVISTTPYTYTQNTSLATTVADDPVPSCGSGDQESRSVWYSFTAPGDGSMQIDTSSSNYNTVLAVWTGTRGALTQVACDDDSGPDTTSLVNFNVTGGTTYYMEVTSRATSGGTLQFHAAYASFACTGYVQNGGFENGWTAWTTTGSPARVNSPVYADSWSARLGGARNADDEVYQSIVVPVGADVAALRYWWYITSADSTTTARDYLDVIIRDSSGTDIVQVQQLDNTDLRNTWQQTVLTWPGISAYAGQTIQVYFHGTNNNNNQTTFFYGDQVSLVVCPRLGTVDLAVTKSASPDPVVAGTTLTYTLAFTNSGPSNAQNVILTDTLPVSVTFGGIVSQSPLISGPAQAGQQLVWTAPTLAAGAAGAIVFTVMVDANASGTIVNNADITSSTPDPNPGNNNTNEPTVIVRERLALTKSALGTPADWWDANWTRRVKLTFDNSAQAENLLNFPVLVMLNNSRIDYSQAQSAGQDIRFIDADGTTVLAHEIERWDAAGSSYVWVRVSQIDGASNADYIWLYYGNASAPDGQNATGTWDSNYRGVWHLSENATAGQTTPDLHIDSTSNHNDGTQYQNFTAPGQIANGQGFDGVNDYIGRVNPTNMPNTNAPMTLEVWAYYTSNPTGNRNLILVFQDPGSAVQLGFRNGSSVMAWTWGGNPLVTYPAFPTANAWHHYAYTYDGTTNRLYVDGVLRNTSTAALQAGTVTNVAINIDDRWNECFNGSIDEARVSGVARSADWIAAQWRSMNDTFITFSSPVTVVPVIAGNTLTYTLSIANVGDVPASGVVMTDALPANTSFVTATPPYIGPASGVVTWSWGTLSVGDSRVVTLVVRVDSAVDSGATITNTAGRITARGLTGTATITTPITTLADLAVTKSDSPDPVVAGSTLTYTLVYTNSGPSDARRVSITDTLPASTTFGGVVSTTPSITLTSTSPPAWYTPTLKAGASGNIVFTVTVNAAASGIITNSVVITSGTPDPSLGNNTANASTAITTAVANLAVFKSDSPDPVTPGARLTYTLVYSNAGPANARNVTLTDTLPTSVTFGGIVSAAPSIAGPTQTGRLLTWYTPTLAAGASGTIVFTVTVNAAASGVITNSVVITSSTPDPSPGNNTANASTSIVPFVRVQFSSGSYGVSEGAGTAAITVTLNTASGLPVTVTYATSDGTATAGPSGDYTAASGALTFPPGATSRVFTVTIINDTLYENNETVLLTLSNPTNATITGTNPATLTIVDDDPPPTVRFEYASYSVVECNCPATINVVLSAASGLTVTVSYATSDGSAVAPGDYTATSGTLTFAPGDTQKSFNVQIIDDALIEPDETLTLVLSNPISATLGGINPVILTIIDNDVAPNQVTIGKTVSSSTLPEPGKSLTYTYAITIHNAGPSTVSVQQITDTLPMGFTYITTTTGFGDILYTGSISTSGQAITWTYTSAYIPGGNTATLTFQARASGSFTLAQYCNNAGATVPGLGVISIGDSACVGWPIYEIETHVAGLTIRARVRMENGRPVILLWEIR